MLTDKLPAASARRSVAVLTRRPRRRLTLLLILLMGVLGASYLTLPLLSLADGPLRAVGDQVQRGLEATVRYIPETRVQEVVDPKTGKVTQEKVVIWRPATETTNHGGPAGAPTWQPVTAVPLSDAERRAFELAQRIRQAESQTEQEPLRQELAQALSEAFDERRQHQQQAIERLEQQLKALRELAAKRDERKDEIIQRRVAELLGQPDPLAWDAELPGAPGARAQTGSYGIAPVSPGYRFGTPPAYTPPPAPASPVLPTLPPGSSPFGAPPAPVSPTPAPPATLPPGPTPYAPSLPPSPISVPPDAVPAAESAGEFDAAERLLNRLIELRQIRVEIQQWQQPLPNESADSDSTAAAQARKHELERKQNLARLTAKEQAVLAKLELAEVSWQAVEQKLRSDIKIAELQAQTATRNAEAVSKRFDTNAASSNELQAARHAQERRLLELEAVKQQLAAWEKTDATIRKQREALESLLEPSEPQTGEEPAPTE